jgi:hypothetical protein
VNQVSTGEHQNVGSQNVGGQKNVGSQQKNIDASTNNDDESKISKVLREGVVLGGGLGRSVLYGMASLPQRLPEIGASMAIGAALSTLSKTGSLGAAATFVVGAYFTSRFVLNAIHDTPRWNKFGAAVADAWHSDQHIMKDLIDVSDSGGNFAFDTGLSMASGYVGFKNKALGDLIISVIKLPVPIPAVATMSPALMTAGMYMDIVPPPFFSHDSRWEYPYFRGSHTDLEDKGNDKSDGTTPVPSRSPRF